MNLSLRSLRQATVIVAALVVALMMVSRPAEAAAATIYPTGSTGYDVSWPNCTATAPAHPSFGIVGVSDGTGYSQNPCLAKEAAWFPNLSLYVNTGWYNQSSYINP